MVPEDFFVFADGDAPFALSSASYTSEKIEPITILRQSPFTIKFLTDQTYQIVDDKTETILAERDFDVKKGRNFLSGVIH